MNTPAKDKTQSYGRADEKTKQSQEGICSSDGRPTSSSEKSPVLVELENIGQSVSTDTTEDEAVAAAVLAQLNA